MKRIVTYLLPVFAGLSATLHASIDLGNGLTLFPTATASVQYNDNLFLNANNKVDETLWTFTPGATLKFGDSALNSGQFSYGEQFQVYNDQDNLNTSISLVDFASSYDDGKMKLSAAAWYHQANQASRDVRNASFLVRRELSHGSLVNEVKWTDKTSVRVGVTYDDTDYKPAGYKDWRWVEVPVNVYYKVQPKLDLSAGVRYRDNTISSGIDSKEYFYNVGARGEIAPKLVGEVSVGYIDFQPISGTDKSALGLDAKFTFAATAKTTLNFGGQSQYGYSALGEAYRNEGISGGFEAGITSDIRVAGQAFYNKYTYTTTSQKDDFSGAQLGVTWTLSRELVLTGAYSYAKNDSNVAISNFKNSILSLTASYRY